MQYVGTLADVLTITRGALYDDCGVTLMELDRRTSSKAKHLMRKCVGGSKQN